MRYPFKSILLFSNVFHLKTTDTKKHGLHYQMQTLQSAWRKLYYKLNITHLYLQPSYSPLNSKYFFFQAKLYCISTLLLETDARNWQDNRMEKVFRSHLQEMGEGSVSWVMKHCLVAPKSLQTLPGTQRLRKHRIITILQRIILTP